MNIIDIPIAWIIAADRVRSELGDVDRLAQSLDIFGMIQPIVVTKRTGGADPTWYSLVAGGRRLAAASALGWSMVPCVIRENLTEADIAELELEENVRRKDLDWHERVRSIAKVHYARSRNAALASEEWGYDETGELLGVVRSDVHYALKLAQLLDASDVGVNACKTVGEALQLLAARKEADAERTFLSKRIDVVTPSGTVLTTSIKSDPTFNAPLFTPKIEVRFMDSIGWLMEQPDNSIDHFYTDPPYAIDMDNVQQDGIGMDVSTVRDTHQVEENRELLMKFLRIAPYKLKPTGFLVMWCDFEHFVHLAGCCVLRAQRWPLIWVKTSQCQNGAANYNFTKATECAIVFAGPKAVLAKPAPTNYWSGPGDKTDHSPTNPFWKPLALHRWILSHIAMAGTCICDPFAGSGSIPLAALGLGYDIIAVEKDQKHYIDLCTKLKVG